MTFPTDVQVTVKTLKNNKEKSGFWVRCNPRAYGNSKPARYPFNSVSSPTERLLPPGNYQLWVEDSAGKVLNSQPISIGDNGKSQTIMFAIE